MKIVNSIAARTISLAIKNYVNFNFWNPDPPAILWHVTHQCIFKCRHCTLHLQENNLSGEELLKLAEKIALSKTPLIAITGGEPLVLPDIKEIIQILKASHKYISLNTNGFLLMEFADFLIDQKVDSVCISLDSPDKETHNDLRGNSLSFDRVMEAIDYILKNRKGGIPSVELRYTITNENYQHINEFYDVFSTKADKLSFQPVNDLEMILIPADRSLLFDPSDLITKGKLEKAIDRLNRKDHRSLHSDIINFIYQNKKFREKVLNHCIPKISNYMLVLNNGDCFMCGNIYGNLLKQEIKEVWNSGNREALMLQYTKKKVCDTPCLLNCNYYGNYFIGSSVKCYLRYFYTIKNFFKNP